MNVPIKSFLYDLDRELRSMSLSDVDTMEEIESHLLESVEHGLRQGLSREKAEHSILSSCTI